MRKITKALIVGIALLAGALQTRESPGAETGPTVAADHNEVVDVSRFGPAVSNDDLLAQAGRQDTQIDQMNVQVSNMNQKGWLEGNVLESTATGNNYVGDNAFANVNGLATVIQNSGNQVLIQNSMTLNLDMQ